MSDEQGLAYAAFIQSELDSERARRSYIDARGLTILTTSGSMVTLLAAVGAFVSSDKNFSFPAIATPFLILTLASFTCAAACGIIANRAVAGEVTHLKTLRRIRTEHWEDVEVDARSFVTHMHINMIESLREASRKKTDWLFIGYWSQLGALTFLSVTIFFVIASA